MMLKLEHINIVVMQETHLKRPEITYLKHIFQSTIYHVPACSTSKGKMLSFKKKHPWVLLQET